MSAPAFAHCFERAGLGVAPYRCVGFHKSAGTCCALCGTPIVYCYEIQGADGRKFVVGSDCAGATGDAGLLQSIKNSPEVRAANRAKAAAKDAAVTAELTEFLANPPADFASYRDGRELLLIRESLKWCGAAGRVRNLRRIRNIIAGEA